MCLIGFSELATPAQLDALTRYLFSNASDAGLGWVAGSASISDLSYVNGEWNSFFFVSMRRR